MPRQLPESCDHCIYEGEDLETCSLEESPEGRLEQVETPAVAAHLSPVAITEEPSAEEVAAMRVFYRSDFLMYRHMRSVPQETDTVYDRAITE